jgi:hypothetical protein
MREYRIDLVTSETPENKPLYCEYFEARTGNAACIKARRILRPHVTDPQAQYGDLWMRDEGGGTTADYVATIEVA